MIRYTQDPSDRESTRRLLSKVQVLVGSPAAATSASANKTSSGPLNSSNAAASKANAATTRPHPQDSFEASREPLSKTAISTSYANANANAHEEALATTKEENDEDDDEVRLRVRVPQDVLGGLRLELGEEEEQA